MNSVGHRDELCRCLLSGRTSARMSQSMIILKRTPANETMLRQLLADRRSHPPHKRYKRRHCHAQRPPVDRGAVLAASGQTLHRKLKSHRKTANCPKGSECEAGQSTSTAFFKQRLHLQLKLNLAPDPERNERGFEKNVFILNWETRLRPSARARSQLFV
jgi:hypothetical protein